MGCMRAALSLLLPVAVALVGCGPKPQQVGGALREGPPPKIVSLSPSTTELIGSAFDTRMLVGRTAADNFPSNVTSIPVVAEVKPDFEKIKKAAPGLVIYDGDLYNDADIKHIESMGITTYAVKAKTIGEFEKELYELGNKLGGETNVSSYVDRIERERNAAEGAQPTPKPKVALILAGGGNLLVAGTGSFQADVLKTVGGEPVGPDADRFAPMSPEALVAAAPDVIVLGTSKATADKDFATLKSNPRLATIPAIRNGKVTALNQDEMVRKGGRVDKFIKNLHLAVTFQVQK
ncbi:MAG: ABC transporter substrate-binding protein [Alphaproteobacteria bacterium]|nr:MAG: ABC transporter substrate-binding protein [Alphaproteobacteria bacterium]